MKKKHSFRMAIIVLCAVLVLPLVLVNCERANDVSQSDEQMPKIVSNWQIIDNNYVDEFGNHGNLWVDLNNPTQKVFEITIQSKACSQYATGDLYKHDDGRGCWHWACNSNTVNNCWKNKEGYVCACVGEFDRLKDTKPIKP